MRLVTWNVNGLRAVLKKGFEDIMAALDPDVVCLQETKAQADQIEVDEGLFPWQYVNCAERKLKKGFEDIMAALDPDVVCLQETKAQADQIEVDEGLFPWQYVNCAERKGYSGTMILSLVEPALVTAGIGAEEHDGEGRVLTADMGSFYLVNVYVPNSGDGLKRLEYRLEWDRAGIGAEEHDGEGRVLTADMGSFYLVNVYVPNSGDGLKRLEYRLEWDRAFSAWLRRLEETKPVLACGDFNVARTELDVWDEEAAASAAGYTLHERESFQQNFLSHFVDVFRTLHPGDRQYTWWSYYSRGRERNQGERIDYWLASPKLMDRIRDIRIRDDIFGSDHCPVEIELDD